MVCTHLAFVTESIAVSSLSPERSFGLQLNITIRMIYRIHNVFQCYTLPVDDNWEDIVHDSLRRRKHVIAACCLRYYSLPDSFDQEIEIVINGYLLDLSTLR
ncbi:3159_t:CDS:1, partial [Funneliformis caledonium]